jgi:predicted RND superfamily exporter protein
MTTITIADSQFVVVKNIESLLQDVLNKLLVTSDGILIATNSVAADVKQEVPFISNILTGQDIKLKNVENHINNLVIIISVLGILMVILVLVLLYRYLRKLL